MAKNKHTTTDNPNYRIITVEQPVSLAAESYRRIKTSLEFANVDKQPQVSDFLSCINDGLSNFFCSRFIRVSIRYVYN